MGKNNSCTYIDIFAGCGGLSLGLFKAGWHGLFAIEKSKMAFETLNHNLMDKKKHFAWPDWLPQKAHNIKSILRKYPDKLRELSGKVGLVAGGPPCQGFSSAGRRKENDRRNKLVDDYIRFIQLVNPSLVFFENVKGFTIGFKKKRSRGEAYSQYVVKNLEQLGYNVQSQILDFSEFGIPQRRKRFILVGVRHGDAKMFFDRMVQARAAFLKQKGLGNKKITVQEAISDLERRNGEIFSATFEGFSEGKYSEARTKYQKLMREDNDKLLPDSHRFPNHSNDTVEKFKFILEKCTKNKMVDEHTKKKFALKKRCIIPLDKNKESPTLTTLPDDYIHYREPRILTVREYARIQSFDDWFEFRGKYTTGGLLRRREVPRYTQIGNAIPPLFGELSGRVLKEMLNE